jgi:hypothetical protein
VQNIFIHSLKKSELFLMKFGRGINFDGRKVLSWVLTLKPDPQDQGGAINRVWGASAASTMRLGKIFIKQKL